MIGSKNKLGELEGVKARTPIKSKVRSKQLQLLKKLPMGKMLLLAKVTSRPAPSVEAMIIVIIEAEIVEIAQSVEAAEAVEIVVIAEGAVIVVMANAEAVETVAEMANAETVETETVEIAEIISVETT